MVSLGVPDRYLSPSYRLDVSVTDGCRRLLFGCARNDKQVWSVRCYHREQTIFGTNALSIW